MIHNVLRLWQGISRGIAALLLSAGLFWAGALDGIDRWVYDHAFLLGSSTDSTDQVVVVEIDEESLRAEGRWPWARDRQAALLSAIAAAKPKKVAVDILLTEPSPEPDADIALAKVLGGLPGTVLPVGFSYLRSSEQVIELFPLPEFSVGATFGHALLSYDDDGMLRRYWARGGVGGAVWPQIAQALVERDQRGRLAYADLSLLTDDPSDMLELQTQDAVGIHFGHLYRPTPSVSAVQVLRGDANALLAGRHVMVGVTAPGLASLIAIPQVGGYSLLSGVHINALIARNLLDGVSIHTAPTRMTLTLSVVAVLMLALAGAHLQGRVLLLTHFAVALLVVVVSLLLVFGASLWLPPSIALVGILANVVLNSVQVLDRAKREARTDALTGLLNRRGLWEAYSSDQQRARRMGLSVGLMIVDVDHFKLYNDCYGHQMGDAVLQKVARLLQQGTRRDSSQVARIGGEEFAVTVFSGDPDAFVAAAGRLREHVSAALIPHLDSPLAHLTISVGTAWSEDAAVPLEALYDAADRGLYQAKRDGRNRVADLQRVHIAVDQWSAVAGQSR